MEKVPQNDSDDSNITLPSRFGKLKKLCIVFIVIVSMIILSYSVGKYYLQKDKLPYKQDLKQEETKTQLAVSNKKPQKPQKMLPKPNTNGKAKAIVPPAKVKSVSIGESINMFSNKVFPVLPQNQNLFYSPMSIVMA